MGSGLCRLLPISAKLSWDTLRIRSLMFLNSVARVRNLGGANVAKHMSRQNVCIGVPESNEVERKQTATEPSTPPSPGLRHSGPEARFSLLIPPKRPGRVHDRRGAVAKLASRASRRNLRGDFGPQRLIIVFHRFFDGNSGMKSSSLVFALALGALHAGPIIPDQA